MSRFPHNRRVSVAIIANAPTPYRVYQNARIAREMPEIALSSAFLAEKNNQAWSFDELARIGTVQLGPGEAAEIATRPGTLLRSLRKGWRLIQEMRSRRVQAAVVFGYNYAECWMALVWGRIAGVPCFLAGDCNAACDVRATGWRRTVKNAVVRGAVRLSRGVMPMGRLGRMYFERYGAKPDRVYMFPYEADSRLADGLDDEQLDAVRERFELSRERRRIVCSGRHVDVKAWDVAIETFNAIADERPDWDLVMVGDGELRAQLEARVRPDLKDRVKWTGFVSDASELSAIYRCCDILLHPARYEPWGVVVQEAVAAGLVVVASDVTGAAADLVDDAYNGRIVKADDIEAFVEATLDATTPSRLRQMKRASVEQLEEWYARHDCVDGLRAALRDTGVLPTPASGRATLRPALAS